MNLPHPENYLYLSTVISENWADLLRVANTSQFSKSLPRTGGDNNRAIYAENDYKLLPEFRITNRAKVRYILKTDVAKFYSSIYTHSIPWAIYGKEWAKQNRGIEHFGNNLDKKIRDAQDGQTKGIPIGPDVSLLISEVILSGVDTHFSRAMPGINGFRHMDDYEFGFQTFANAEEGLAVLQHALGEYELEVNYQKTHIEDLPLPLEDDWKFNLMLFDFSQEGSQQRADIIRYFSLAYTLSKKTPNTSVIKYAIKRIRDIELDPANWSLLQELILQAVCVETGTLYAALEIFVDWNSGQFELDLNSIAYVLNLAVELNSKTGLDSEVAWGIWAMINWGLPITERAAQAVSSVDDSIVAILALDAQSRGLIPAGLDTNAWRQYASSEDLYGAQWLLAYEGNIKGWLLSNDGLDYVAQDPFFSALRQQRVEFYNPNAPFRVIPETYGL